MMKRETPDVNELIRLVQPYYPPGHFQFDDGYDETPEGQRFRRLWDEGLKDEGAWQAMLEALRTAHPECTLWDYTIPLHGVCRYLRIILQPPETPPGQPEYTEVCGLASVIAPYYIIFSSYHCREPSGQYSDSVIAWDPKGGRCGHYARILSEHFEQYLGHRPIAWDALQVVVPDLSTGLVDPGDATLLDLLFIDHRIIR